MSGFIRKHRNFLIISAAIIITLTAVFFLADGPEIKKNEKSASGSVSGASAIVVESHNVSVSSNQDTEISADSVISEISYISSSQYAVSSSLPAESSIQINSEDSIVIQDESSESVSEEKSTVKTDESSESVPEESPVSTDEDSSEVIIEESSEQSLEESSHKCTVSINCSVLNDHIDELAKNKRPLVPSDGVILSPITVEFEDGDSVFDITKRICRENRIHLEFTMTPIYNTAYIEGIYNLYEFDCGSASGWVYSVNGEIPSYGCSDYKVSDGDTIIWHYTCALGNDIIF